MLEVRDKTAFVGVVNGSIVILGVKDEVIDFVDRSDVFHDITLFTHNLGVNYNDFSYKA